VNGWTIAGDLGQVAGAFVAAGAAVSAWAAARAANNAAASMARIELARRYEELCPRFRVIVEPWSPGSRDVRLRVMLLGPPSLARIDKLTTTVRDDHFRRGDGQLLAGGPTREQIKEQIWGPYRFNPGVGPDEAHADRLGRAVVYDDALPVGEELPYRLELTLPPSWATATSAEDWRRERGDVLRLALQAEHADHGSWTLPVEIDAGDGSASVTVIVP
jgi:hypothetical protein